MRTLKQTFALLACSALVLAAALFVAPQSAHALCLDYWAKGPSGCNGKQPAPQPEAKPKKDTVKKDDVKDDKTVEEEPEEKPEEEMTEEEKKEAKLEKDITKFYERHGKPPEEFVRFYMDPTPENALAWVKKYNENLQRSRQLAAAWTQAQQIYTDFHEKGMEIPPELLPEYAKNDPNALPPVQDLGLPLPEGLDDVFGKKKTEQSPAPSGDTSSAIGGLNGDRTIVMGEDRRIGGGPDPVAEAAASGVIKVSYYFSAECPYCRKFEPGFKNVIKDMGQKLDVTCVDMTPSGQDASNVHAGITCQWRPLLPGEKNAMGVDATPTLIIDRGPDQPLERVSGYVDETKLRQYLNKSPETK